MKKFICVVLSFIFLIVRVYGSEVITPVISDSYEEDLIVAIEILERSGVLEKARQMQASALVAGEPLYEVMPMVLPELGPAAGAAGLSVSWGVIALLAACAVLCVGVGYAAMEEEDKAIVNQWFADRWDLACEYYCNMSSYSRAFLSYCGKLIDRSITGLNTSMTEAVEAFPEVPEEGWAAVRNQVSTATNDKGLPISFRGIYVGSEMQTIQGNEVRVGVHSLMADLYDRLGRTNNSTTYIQGGEYSKRVKTLFSTEEVLLPSTPVNVWGDTPFGVKVIATERAYNYGWKMGYVDLQYHFVGTDGLAYYLEITYNKKLSSSQAVADSRVQTYGNLSYADNESGYIVSLCKAEDDTALGTVTMHVQNHLTQYNSEDMKVQAEKMVGYVLENTGVQLDLSNTTNYLYFLDLSPFPDDFKLGTNGWIATHNGYEIKEPALIYPAGNALKISNTGAGFDGVIFKPYSTTNTPTIMTPEEMRKKYNPTVVVEPVVIPDNPFPITEVIDPEPTPTVSPTPIPDEDEVLDYEPATELDFEPLKVAGGLLATKFPFSLPFDLMAIVDLFNVKPIAPTFEVELKNFVPSDFKDSVDIVYKLDFADYQVVVDILRWFLLLIFISGLIKMTSALIKH